MATPYDGVAQECSGRLRRARGAQEGSGGLGTAREASKMTKMQNCIQIIVKSCKSVGLYAKVGGVGQGHPWQKWQKCETLVENATFHNLTNY